MRMLRHLAVVFGFGVVLLGASTPAPPRADHIIILKSKRQLTLYRSGVALKTYSVALGGAPTGAKRCQGDRRTPEGIYRVDARNLNSHYHRSLHISYPNRADVAKSQKAGCAPGGDIMIHGITNGWGWIGARHRAVDWTAGCIAVTNEEIEEIWRDVPNGTVVEIRP